MFLGGSGRAFTAMPALLTEFPGGGVLNFRLPMNLTGRQYLRFAVGGGVDGTSTSELVLQLTLDLTGATGWDFADRASGVRTGIADLGGSDSPQYSPWFDIHPDFRTWVLARICGFGGNGVVSPSFSSIVAYPGGHPKWARQSLENVRAGDPLHPRDYIYCGGSQHFGGGTAGTGPTQFGELPAPLRVIPGGSQLIVNGSPLSVIPHTMCGIEAGFLHEFADANLANGVRLLGRGHDATSLSDWTSSPNNHLDQLAADVTAAGMTPRLIYYVQSVSDSVSGASVGALDAALRRFIGRCQNLWPGIGVCVLGLTSTDPTTVPFAVEARTRVERRLREPANGQQCWIPWNEPEAFDLQGDAVHMNVTGITKAGRREARVAIDAGVH